MTNNQKITLNIVVNLISFAITIFISLFVTPLIVNTLGGEAYGFVSLAQNFVGYAALITVALNSMASRFVSIEIYRQDFKEASRYFSSVFLSNLLIALVLVPVFAVIVCKLELFIEIPAALVGDVKITFAITFFQFLLSILLSHYEIATFVTNRLYLSQKNTLISSMIRLLLILICFRVFDVRVSYVVAATLAGHLFGYAMNVIYTRRYLPELQVRRKDFSFPYVRRLAASGVWNLLNKLSGILLDGLDLLISNLFIGPVEMGALAISKTVPAMFTSLRGTLDYPFAPPMTQCYAEGDIDGVIRNARTGNKILGILMIAPLATFAIYGQSFFKLWVPEEDSLMIQILSLLSIMSLIAGACTNSILNIFTITNRIKIPSIIVLINGILTAVTLLFALKYTSLGVYAIAGVSSVYGLLRHLLFTPLYGAHCLGVKRSTFYHEILTGILCLLINLGVGLLAFKLCTGDSWLTLILSAGCMAVVCIAINFFVVLRKPERQALLSAVLSRLHKNKQEG